MATRRRRSPQGFGSIDMNRLSWGEVVQLQINLILAFAWLCVTRVAQADDYTHCGECSWIQHRELNHMIELYESFIESPAQGNEVGND